MNLASVLCALFAVHIVESSMFTGVDIVRVHCIFWLQDRIFAIFTVHIVESALFTVDIVECIVHCCGYC